MHTLNATMSNSFAKEEKIMMREFIIQGKKQKNLMVVMHN